MNNIVYLDNAATTKPSGTAISKASIYNDELFYNASSVHHNAITCAKSITQAKDSLLKYFGNNFEVIFTSCGSESDNMAINSYLKRGNAVTTMGEHSAVYNPFIEYKNNGYDARFASLNADGSVNIDNLLSLIDKNTVFVSVVHVNNETGAINDINKIASLCKKINPRLVFHSDGVQAFMKVPYVLSNDIDLYSLSAHKINGLKGVGAIIKNKKLKTLKPLILGGGQENGYRSGTENVFGIKVFEYAFLERFDTLNQDFASVKALKERFLEKLDKSLVQIISSENCSPYIINFSAVGLKGEVLLHKLESHNIIVGTGSACSSKNRFSRVLKSIGYSDSVLDGVLRVSFSAKTTIEEVDYAVEKINLCISELSKMVNLWKMQ